MCTNFSLFSTGANSSYVVSARTMDFAEDLNTKLEIVPRGQSFPGTLTTPIHNPLKWQNKYGYVGMTCGPTGVKKISDGINETGLSIGALWLAGSEYPSEKSATTPTLYNVCFCEWVLGNFDSIESIKSALNSLTVISINERIPEPSIVLHFAITDSSGANLIVEFTSGQMQTYNSDNSVMTNAPPYPYHLDNLSNYVNLSPKNNPTNYWGQQINGSGLLGMPGDYTAPSRFIRASLLQKSTDNYTPKNQEEAVGLAARILQNFGTPKGSVVTANSDSLDYTQWGVIRDHKNLGYYFFTQFNNNLFSIDLKSINFSQDDTQSLSIIQENWVTDLTPSLNH
ncbi:MAG: linear amide C-N hydrolase [Microcystaceae cyanobacterium]